LAADRAATALPPPGDISQGDTGRPANPWLDEDASGFGGGAGVALQAVAALMPQPTGPHGALDGQIPWEGA